MAPQVLLRSPAVTRNMQPMAGKVVRPENSTRFGEVAGEAAAECAAICCCCPCTMIDLLVLAVYKVPAGLCKKARRRHRLKRKKMKQDGLLVNNNSWDSREELEREAREAFSDGYVDEVLEKEMWDQFWGAGFWRSSSQRVAEPYIDRRFMIDNEFPYRL